MTRREQWARVLQENQIKPSYPRLCIYSYLAESKSHPTADEIYLALHDEMPTLSKMTVYNTLNILIEKKLARLISIEEHEARYDANTQLHGHFKCSLCDRVIDFPVQDQYISYDNLKGFDVMEKDIFFRGICPSCKVSGGKS